jgi:hypothetical protein
MAIPGKLELTIKLNQFPDPVATGQNGWKEFRVDCGPGREVTVTLRPKLFAKLEAAQAAGTPWVAALAGQLGPRTPTGFALTEPNLQVFARKPTPPADAPPTDTPPAAPAP